jgi:predicted HD superfamily hydrolase involved in NAD metabolism
MKNNSYGFEGIRSKTMTEAIAPEFEPTQSQAYETLRKRAIEWLERHVPTARIQHILRVERLSLELARHHRLDTEKAAIAGLLHDLAKYFKPPHLLEIARSQGWELDPVLQANPHLIHADASAVVARDEFGIEDEEILQAIANHTLGNPNMSPLSCVVFLADTLEPGRGNTPELNALREACDRDLYEAVWRTGDYSIQYLLERRRLIHPRTILTRNWALQLARHGTNTLEKRSTDDIPA